MVAMRPRAVSADAVMCLVVYCMGTTSEGREWSAAHGIVREPLHARPMRRRRREDGADEAAMESVAEETGE
jgi:hypothetical protein